jgi:hypothetical protein
MTSPNPKQQAKRYKRKQLVFEAVFAEDTDPLMYEELDGYLKSVGVFETPLSVKG